MRIEAAQIAQGLSGAAMLNYVAAHGSESSLSASADINYTYLHENHGTIVVTGSSSGSQNLPFTLSEYISNMMNPAYQLPVGSKFSSSKEDTRTFKISGGDGFYTYNGYKIAGIVTVEEESSSGGEFLKHGGRWTILVNLTPVPAAARPSFLLTLFPENA